MNEALTQRILEALQCRRPAAAFVNEVVSTLQPTPLGTEVEAALQRLVDERAVLVVDHAPPDIHLVGTDLRVVARSGDAREEHTAHEVAEAHWNAWLREFLATHRCQ